VLTGPLRNLLKPLGAGTDPPGGAASTAPDGTTTVTLPLRLACTSEARLRLTLRTTPLAVVRTLPGPIPLALGSAAGSLTLLEPLPPDRVSTRLTGRFGPVRRTASSPSPLALPPSAGTVVSGVAHVARLIDAVELEGHPLVRAALLGAAEAGELVVELRAGAGGPGPVVAAAGVTNLDTTATPRWHAVDVGPLDGAAVPATGLWLVARTNAGRLLWGDGPAGPAAMVSADEGLTWTPLAASPALALYIRDPGGAADVVARAGSAPAVGRADGTLLLRPPGESFDTVVGWPGALLPALADPAGVVLDAARDLAVEVADVRLARNAALTLGRPT
jgi:hypothetical protein